VQRKNDKKLYAMKYINKKKCIEQRAVTNTIFERNLLEQVHHPLIVNLRYAFQDDENMFMVLDLMLGGDLKYHLEKTVGHFDEECVRQYAAEICSALMHLHDNGVVHRDVKPENVLLDADGHAHLTDFNVAAFLPEDGRQLKSIAGTLSYMAPEVIGRKGYREGPDWWSLGVTLYELMFGRRPFRGHSGREVCTRILDGTFSFPEGGRHPFSNECLDFVNGLLQKDPKYRLGVDDLGRQRLKAHPFLKATDWCGIEDKRVKPRFMPNQKGNFNPLHEAEDVLLEESPLNPNRRKSSMPVADPELYRIQDEYADYNWRLDVDGDAKREQSERLRLASANIEAKLERASMHIDDPRMSNQITNGEAAVPVQSAGEPMPKAAPVVERHEQPRRTSASSNHSTHRPSKTFAELEAELDEKRRLRMSMRKSSRK